MSDAVLFSHKDNARYWWEVLAKRGDKKLDNPGDEDAGYSTQWRLELYKYEGGEKVIVDRELELWTQYDDLPTKSEIAEAVIARIVSVMIGFAQYATTESR